MKLGKLFSNWGDTVTISKQLMMANIALSVALVGLVLKLNTDHERVVLVPPHLDEKAMVNWREASGNYMEGWGLFIAASIGSLTPQNASTIADTMGRYFNPLIYPRIRTQIMSIVDDPNYAHSGMINLFTPKAVQWEASTEKVFVQGVLETMAYKNTSQSVGQKQVTYEMVIKMVGGIPTVMKFNSYLGQPRTIKWRDTHKAQLEAEEKAASKQVDTDSILPQDAEIRGALEDAAKKAAERPSDPASEPSAPSKAEPAASAKDTGKLPTAKEKL